MPARYTQAHRGQGGDRGPVLPRRAEGIKGIAQGTQLKNMATHTPSGASCEAGSDAPVLPGGREADRGRAPQSRTSPGWFADRQVRGGIPDVLLNGLLDSGSKRRWLRDNPPGIIPSPVPRAGIPRQIR